LKLKSIFRGSLPWTEAVLVLLLLLLLFMTYIE
jgi:hypothetical protein